MTYWQAFFYVFGIIAFAGILILIAINAAWLIHVCRRKRRKTERQAEQQRRRGFIDIMERRDA